VQPQIIVISSDGNGRMQTTEAAPDYGYIEGCHAIPNGYHLQHNHSLRSGKRDARIRQGRDTGDFPGPVTLDGLLAID
jgi:hypothetical protein